MRLDDLLRAVMLLLGILSFLGWGFSGESGLVGLSLLISTGAVLAVAPTPNKAFGDRLFRICWMMIIALGLASIACRIYATAQSDMAEDRPEITFAPVTAMGLLAGLARVRRPEVGSSHGC
jgi:hypothetical protein